MLSLFDSRRCIGRKPLQIAPFWPLLGIAILLAVTATAVGQKEQFRASDSSSAETSRTEAAATAHVPPIREYRIGADDVLWVSVWKEPELSQQVLVRSDGQISLPLIGDVRAAGQTTQQVQAAVTEKLRDFIASPMVTVVVREARSHSFNILGQVAKPGAYPLDKSTTVLDSVALAGGFREWAKVKSIYVLRRNADGTSTRLPFDYKRAIRGTGGDFELQSRDTIVVP